MKLNKTQYKSKIIRNLLLIQKYLNEHLKYTLGLSSEEQFTKVCEELKTKQEEIDESILEMAILELLKLNNYDVLTVRDLCAILNADEEKINEALVNISKKHNLIKKEV